MHLRYFFVGGLRRRYPRLLFVGYQQSTAVKRLLPLVA